MTREIQTRKKKKTVTFSNTAIIEDESNYKIICLQNENKTNKQKTQQDTSNRVPVNKYLILFLGQKTRWVSNSCTWALVHQSRRRRVASRGQRPVSFRDMACKSRPPKNHLVDGVWRDAISKFKALESELTGSWICLASLLCLVGKEALLCRA